MKTVLSDKAAGKYLFGLLLLMLFGSSLVWSQGKSRTLRATTTKSSAALRDEKSRLNLREQAKATSGK